MLLGKRAGFLKRSDYEEEQNYLDKLEQKRERKKTKSLPLIHLLRAKLRVGPAANRWSREQWGHRLDFIFTS